MPATATKGKLSRQSWLQLYLTHTSQTPMRLMWIVSQFTMTWNKSSNNWSIQDNLVLICHTLKFFSWRMVWCVKLLIWKGGGQKYSKMCWRHSWRSPPKILIRFTYIYIFLWKNKVQIVKMMTNRAICFVIIAQSISARRVFWLIDTCIYIWYM